VRLDTWFPMNPELLAMLQEKEGHRAAFVYYCGLSYSTEHRTGNLIHASVLPLIHGCPADASLLVQYEFWQPQQDGWLTSTCGLVELPASRPPIPDWLRELVYERDEWCCVACASTEDLTLDHIYPWSLGGPDTEDNLQTLCRSCNSRKGARI
jgi:hypothetical protein